MMSRSIVDHSNTRCHICGSKDTAIISNTGRPHWYTYTPNGIWDGKSYICNKCNSKIQNKLYFISNRSIGNLDLDSSGAKGDNFQKLTCEWRSIISTIPVKDLNLENNNYNSPIDHTRDSELGIIQTKGRFFTRNTGAKGGWGFYYKTIEHKKDYDNMILWCVSEHGDIIERGYIIPKKEINKRQGIEIIKDPRTWPPWYEKYRITDEETIKKVNEIWNKIKEVSE